MADKSGDPFGVAEKVSVYYFGLRDWFLQLVKEEREEFRKAQNVQHPPALVLQQDDDCPECGGVATVQAIAGTSGRCFQCGFQPTVYGPPGISRAQLESWQGPDAEHKRKFQQGFGQAVSRLTGRK